jgi:hypothetical protein
MAKQKRVEPVGTAKPAKQLADQAAALVEYAAQALVAAEQLRIKTKVVDHFPLDENERTTAAKLRAIAPKIGTKLKKTNATFTIAEVASMVMSVAESFLDAQPRLQFEMLGIVKKLMDCLHANIVVPNTALLAEEKKPKATGTVFQFKITLLGIKPAIWRRIQVKNCSLDCLHEYIQTSMGWSNSHLHRFEVGKKRYADPMLMEEDMREYGFKDSTTTMLSDIVPKKRKRLRFLYEYDFGDCWGHEVVFEGCPKAEAGAKYPICLEGERACPPEDCGGWPGYANLLEALSNKKHEEHESMMEWVGGWFDSEEFDSSLATKAMKKGLPDWKSMR